MRKGFTLVEMLVVIAISAMVSTIALIYTSESRNQVMLSVETAKVAQIFLRAKDLAVATYNTGPLTCAYGVSFNIASNTYSIFEYTPKSHPPEHTLPPPCPDDTLASTSPINAGEISEYTSDTWNVPLANGVKFATSSANDTIADVLFYPPNPTTWISRDGKNFLDPSGLSSVTSKVYLVTSDGSASSTVTVNGAGQVSF